MKIFFYLFITVIIFLTCDDDTIKDEKPTIENVTTLQIKNQSSRNISKILWNDMQFDNVDNDMIFIGSWTLNNNIYKAVDIEFYGNGSFYIWYWSTNSRYYQGTGIWSRNKDELNLTSTKNDTGRKQTFTGRAFLRSENVIYFDGSYTDIRSNISTTSTEIVYITEFLDRVGTIGQLTPGNSLKNDVNFGSSYIFFTYNSTAYRTKDLLIVNKNEEKIFVFTDYTVVVEVTNPNNIKTLGEL